MTFDEYQKIKKSLKESDKYNFICDKFNISPILETVKAKVIGIFNDTIDLELEKNLKFQFRILSKD